MNERIKQLLGQAYDEAVPETWTTLSSEQLGRVYDKFAELIVRECAETIKKDMELAHIQLIPLDFKMYANGRLLRTIKQHFGVEE